MTARCRYCDQPITWAAHHETGNPMPFNPEPVNWGWTLVRRGDALVSERRPFYQSHFATCSEYPANSLGRKGKRGEVG